MNEQETKGTPPDTTSRRTGGSMLETWTERAGTWLSEETLTGLLAILILDMFVLPVLGSNVGEIALNVVFTVLLFTGLVALSTALVLGAARATRGRTVGFAAILAVMILTRPEGGWSRSSTLGRTQSACYWSGST